MKQSKLFKITSCILSGIMALSFAACGKDKDNTELPSTLTPTSTAAQNFDPLGKYNPPLKLTTVRSALTKQLVNGATMDKNIWYDTYEQELGIKLENMWIVASDQYKDKFNVAIASNDLPDVFDVNKDQKETLVQNGWLADLTDAYDKYTSPLVKTILTQDGGMGMGTAKYNGKLIAIPQTVSISDKSHMIFIRKDWLDKLKLAEPKSMDDLLKIAEAFTKQDPDGNGKNDTYGLALTKDSPAFGGNFGNPVGFFNSYHAYPNAWLKDSSGKLMYGGIQPEMKAPLMKLAQMYKDGLLDKEFAVKDAAKLKEDCAQGKVGIGYGPMFSPIDPLKASKNTDPKADWKPYQLVSADSKPALTSVGSPITVWHVVNAKCKNPEAAIKLTNLWVEKSYSPNADSNKYGTTPEGTEVFGFALNRIEPFTKNLDINIAVVNALNTKDTSKLNSEQKSAYDKVVAYQGGDNKVWDQFTVFGPGGTQSVINNIFNKDKAYLYNVFDGANTPTMLEKNASLSKLQTDMVTKIILGTAGVEEFDKFVGQWKSLGGDTITKEVNDWYKTKK